MKYEAKPERPGEWERVGALTGAATHPTVI